MGEKHEPFILSIKPFVSRRAVSTYRESGIECWFFEIATPIFLLRASVIPDCVAFVDHQFGNIHAISKNSGIDTEIFISVRLDHSNRAKIGRASCRERGYVSVVVES